MLAVQKEASCKTKAYKDLHTMLRDFLNSDPLPPKICLGVAGPVLDGKVNMTNLGWSVNAAVLSQQLGAAVLLVNDLECTANSLAVLEGKDVFVLHEAERFPKGNAAVIAPGTGLGEAGLYCSSNGCHPFATEGGHCGFAPRTDVDLEIFTFFRRTFGHVSQERLVSGPGICALYDFLRNKKGLEEPAWLKEKLLVHDKATVISQNAGECDICHETIQLFLRYLALEAANLVLKLNATGGLFLAGGIVPHLLPFIDKDLFMKWFCDAGRMKPLLREVPVKIILNEKAPLLGAAYYGLQHAATGVVSRKTNASLVK